MAKDKSGTPKKTEAAVSREEFKKNARPIEVTIDGQRLALNVKEFSTGSFGWRNNDKVTIVVGGVPVVAQVGLNLIVVGSKETK